MHSFVITRHTFKKFAAPLTIKNICEFLAYALNANELVTLAEIIHFYNHEFVVLAHCAKRTQHNSNEVTKINEHDKNQQK